MIGKTINNYKIVSELGQGGMGIIYQAYEIKLDRYVAIKVLKSKVSVQQKFTDRFKIEAKNQAKLSHPNIVPVYGFIEENDILAIVMEMVEGETVEQILERKIRLNLPEAIDIIKQVLWGVGYAHSKGFIHRDIKPSNIIISKDNVAKLMDFGISRSLLEKGVTSPGTNIGTLYYMSPEQIRGEEPTVQSDIYSIGITLYEMLAGVVPFDYDNEYQVMEGHLKENAPELQNIVPGLPMAIQRIIDKAISKKARNRYNNYQEFLDDLQKLEIEINKFHKPNPEIKERNTKKYKLKAVSYTVILLSFIFSLFYFSYDQVNELWTNGVNPFFNNGEKVNSGEIISKGTSIKWIKLSSGVKNNLNSIYFINDSTGFCCGSEGTLLSTSDYGTTWEKIQLPTNKELISTSFNNPGQGFVIDESMIYRTADTCKTWEQIRVNRFGKKLFCIKFINSLLGFITGSNGLILKTTNGGNSWYQVESGTGNLLFDVDFTDYKSGFAVGWNGEILKTTDSGETWTRLNTLTTNYLRRIKFRDNLEGFIVGGEGEIFKTTDAGLKWTRQKNEYSFGLYDIEFIDEKNAIIVGGQGKALLTADMGNNWALVSTNVYTGINALTLTPHKKLFGAGVNGTIVRL